MHSETNCIFCEIISGTEPATFHYKESDFVVFENNLKWFPTQLLFVPKEHMLQSDLWASKTLLADMGFLANQVGQERCPSGYRIISNFGEDGMQSQKHAHLHLVGGKNLGMYVWGKLKKPPP
ncbi:MAG: HIT domain-containing protein [SAR202 cluster bacterium]|jgi:histidine triad (HIT) family protein|nr:MAG: HIT domain-containing protein [SAR202 cluster bacterium]MAR86206.1 hypothetical protein [Chloroflexota bacterium]KAA1306943.1 MAG: HIT domain-containing protein [SAR202 cluster bacterium]MEC7733693.1 HIT domain-containing protein [Chloroflexota bacterium]MED5410048.1 HIT domain-containing protein [Chloroflexota bacterium]|tara:strand:- start:10 stop:375 length:366 start_codon:yes stop_codon:yes gene_type:complete